MVIRQHLSTTHGNSNNNNTSSTIYSSNSSNWFITVTLYHAIRLLTFN